MRESTHEQTKDYCFFCCLSMEDEYMAVKRKVNDGVDVLVFGLGAYL